MEFIFHIGSHKTGTSSIQNFLARNRKNLVRHGIYYAPGKNGGRNINHLGSSLAGDRMEEVRQFLENTVKAAKKANVTKILFSGESLYAMSSFFGSLVGRHIEDYWKSETQIITRLANACTEAGASSVRAVCYLRPQDDFIESLYNQFVKQYPGYTHDIGAFYQTSDPVGDYSGHIDLWIEQFGDQSVAVYPYDPAAPALIDHFVLSVLGIVNTEGFQEPGVNVNESLTAEILTFKLILNRIGLPPAEGLLASRVISRIARDMRKKQNQSRLVLLPPELRVQIIEENNPGNRKLAKHYGWDESNGLFPVISPDNIPAPLPVSTSDLLEILLRYKMEMSKTDVRLEIFFRRAIRAMLNRAPVLEYFLGGVRRVLYWRRLHLERMGRL